jgi:hypothetical protein
VNELYIRHASALKKQGMHCNITKATTVKVWVWVLLHTNPLTHLDFFLIVRWGTAWCGHLCRPLP